MGTCCSTYLVKDKDQNFKKDNIKMSDDIRKILSNVNFEDPFKQSDKYLGEKEIEIKYSKIKILGSGLFSKVFLVKTQEGVLLAMKVIKKGDFTSKEQIKKIITEKELMRVLKHRNILQLKNTFQTRDKLYLMLEYASKGKTDQATSSNY